MVGEEITPRGLCPGFYVTISQQQQPKGSWNSYGGWELDQGSQASSALGAQAKLPERGKSDLQGWTEAVMGPENFIDPKNPQGVCEI